MHPCYAYALKPSQRHRQAAAHDPSPVLTKWKDNPLSERAGSRAFFLDLCTLPGVNAPNDPDSYCFERSATRKGAGHGWTDHTPEMPDDEIQRRLLAVNLARSREDGVQSE
jgi:hypothetical protein